MIVKVLIWIGCFFVATVLNVLLGYATGIKVGYFIFYLAVYFVAKKLCEKWEQHKNKDDTNSCSGEHDNYVQIQTEQENKFDSADVVESEGSVRDTNQIRFCRKCGEKLINRSRFCRKCGTEIVSMEDE